MPTNGSDRLPSDALPSTLQNNAPASPESILAWPSSGDVLFEDPLCERLDHPSYLTACIEGTLAARVAIADDVEAADAVATDYLPQLGPYVAGERNVATDFELAAAALAEQVTALLDGETTIETACRLVRCCFKSGLQSGHRYISELGGFCYKSPFPQQTKIFMGC